MAGRQIHSLTQKTIRLEKNIDAVAIQMNDVTLHRMQFIFLRDQLSNNFTTGERGQHMQITKITGVPTMQMQIQNEKQNMLIPQM